MSKFLFAAAGVAAASAQVIPGEYLVQVKDNARVADLTSMHAAEDIMNVYDFPGFSGYAFRGTENEMLRVMENSAVVTVEPNQVMKAFQSCGEVGASSWGLTRINSRTRPTYNGSYRSATSVNQVTQYVLDTGIRMTHRAFNNAGNNRGVDCSGFFGCTEGGDSDRQGHGTHVAGTMGGNDYGVARSSELVPVKVLGDNGSGTTAGVIAGVEWTARDCSQRRGACVGNMSLGGGYSAALNNAVDAAVDAGVVMVVAAGNENQNACNVSPASAAKAITVGSTDSSDRRSSFSNWGSCVDILAPGSSITSAWVGSDSDTRTISGTSMASPHVAGLAALILEENTNLTPAQVLASMLADATANVISDDRGSPNMLAFTSC